ncbi:unnamed protein product [Sphacelaria rigidula]
MPKSRAEPCPVGGGVLLKSMNKLLRVVSERATPEQWAKWLELPFRLAAAGGDTELVHDLLIAGAQACDPLHVLVNIGNASVVRYLLDRGLAPNAQDSAGESPLHVAALRGNAELVSLLLLKGADPNLLTADKTPSPLVAVEERHADAVKTLLEAGADVAVRNRDQCPALDLAATSGNIHTVEHILEHGADATSRSCYHRKTALHYAATYGHQEVVSLLVHHGSRVDEVDCDGNSALMLAAKHGKLMSARALLTNGADVSLRGHGETSWSALDLACIGGHVHVARELRRHGADVDSTSPHEGRTALHFASRHGHEQAASFLIQEGAYVNCLDREGDDPLLLATKHGHCSVTRALLEAGADVDSRDAHHWSALDFATRNGDVDTMIELLQHGAGVASRHLDGTTPLHIASEFNRARAVDVLVEAGVNVNAYNNGNFDIDTPPLHIAAKYNSCDAMLALLRHGADVHAADGMYRQRTLMSACEHLHLEAADLLLRWGADKNNVYLDGDSSASAYLRQLLDNDLLDDRVEDEMRMQMLLARTPADWAWCRRGLLVLCRALPHKWTPRSASDLDGVDMQRAERVSSRTRSKCGKVRERVAQTCSGESDGVHKAGASRESNPGSSCGLEARVVGLVEEDLFQSIVMFL